MKVVVENSRQQIEVFIDLVSIAMPKERHLTGPQRRYLIEMTLLEWRGINTTKRNGLNELREILGWKKEDRQIYRLRSELKSKGWLRKEDGRWKLPPVLAQAPANDVTLNIRVVREEA